MRLSKVITVATPLALFTFINLASAQVTSQTKPGRDVGDAVSKPVGSTSAKTLGSFSSTAFVQNAARSDMYEISAGKLAAQKSGSADVRKFAEKMVQAHTKTTASLKAALAKSGLNIAPPDKLDARRQGLLDNLKAANGSEFDSRYVSQQIAAHQEALDLMKGYADHGDNAALKAAAATTAPLVADHLRMAKMLPGAGG